MTTRNRFGVAVAALGLLAPAALAQTPPPPPVPAVAPPGQRPTALPAQAVLRHTVYRPTAYQYGSPMYAPVPYGAPGYAYHPGFQSILRATPADATWGFRNPGGVGRYADYYPPGNVFQNGGRDPVPRAGFDQGLPVGSIGQQAAAVQLGVQRYSALQQHLDNFSRPLGFYGFFGAGLGVPF